MNSLPLKTPAATRNLRVPYTALISLIRYGKIQHPQKDSSGDYIWTDRDLETARPVLADRCQRVHDGNPSVVGAASGGGRSEDAAKAIYSKFLEEEFRTVATRAKELSRGPA
jgi:hypothetical protein